MLSALVSSSTATSLYASGQGYTSSSRPPSTVGPADPKRLYHPQPSVTTFYTMPTHAPKLTLAEFLDRVRAGNEHIHVDGDMQDAVERAVKDATPKHCAELKSLVNKKIAVAIGKLHGIHNVRYKGKDIVIEMTVSNTDAKTLLDAYDVMIYLGEIFRKGQCASMIDEDVLLNSMIDQARQTRSALKEHERLVSGQHPAALITKFNDNLAEHEKLLNIGIHAFRMLDCVQLAGKAIEWLRWFHELLQQRPLFEWRNDAPLYAVTTMHILELCLGYKIDIKS